MPFCCFGLGDLTQVKHYLDGIDVIINAAGPFAFTAERLAKAALEAGCHYVDINGEVDVYRKLDDLARAAAHREIAIVSGAGHTAATSDCLLDVALQELFRNRSVTNGAELGAVRIAMSAIGDFSRGSALTLARSLREQVIVIRKGPVDGQPNEQMVIWHEPFGKLERTFDFDHLPPDNNEQRPSMPSIALAVNLIDTLTARLTMSRHDLSAQAIESYAQAGIAQRIAFQLGATFASLSSFPPVRAMAKVLLGSMPDGPPPQLLAQERNVVLLEIEDVYRARLIDWRWETPNVYQFSAQLVVAVACSIAAGVKIGWVTPSDALALQLPDLESPSAALRNTKLEKRVV